MRNRTLEGRMIVSRMLPISKIVFLALLTKVPYRAVEELENSFFGKTLFQKLNTKHVVKN